MECNIPVAIESALDELNEHQLRILNHMVVEKLKLLSKAHQLRSMARFNVTDRVYFDHHGKRITGVIIRLNQKTVTINTVEGFQWNVAPVFLTKFYEENPDNDHTPQKFPYASRNAPCPCGSGKKHKRCCAI